MDNDDVIDHQDNGEAVVAQMQQDVAEDTTPQPTEGEKMVPLSTTLKERKKRQEAEMNAQYQQQQLLLAQQQLLQLQQQQSQNQVPADDSRFESATKEDLGKEVTKSQAETVRIIEEKMWIKANPEKYEKLNENLPQFLKLRPNLIPAINTASNRYEEAWELMDKLTPKEKQALKAPPVPKKEAPNSPSSVPKGAALGEAMDVMSMSDEEYSAWRETKKKRR